LLSLSFTTHTAPSKFYLLSLHDALPICPSQFATRRTLFHVLVGCGLLMLKVSRLKLPVIWLLVSMWLNTLTKSQIWTNSHITGSFKRLTFSINRPRSEERFSRNAETDLVCSLLLEI